MSLGIIKKIYEKSQGSLLPVYVCTTLAIYINKNIIF